MVQHAERASATPAPRNRRQRIEAAIQAALRGDWKLAADENRALLKDDPSDVEAANRLGKALTELGQKKQAIEAYRQALQADPANAIARKNLTRLEESKGGKGSKGSRAKKVEVKPEVPRAATSLIEASDRAAEFILQQPNWKELAKVEPGEHATVEPSPRGVVIKSHAGDVLGFIEPRAGLRLRRMIEGGNRYDVVIRVINQENGAAIVLIRETYKHPSLVGQASFLQAPSARRRVMRAYTKPVVRQDRDVDFEFDTEDSDEPVADAWRPRRSAPVDDDESFGDDDTVSDEPIDLADDDLPIADDDEESEEGEDSED